MIQNNNIAALSGRKSGFAYGMFDGALSGNRKGSPDKSARARVEAHRAMREIDYHHNRNEHAARVLEAPEYIKAVGAANLDVTKDLDRHKLKHEVKSTKTMHKVNSRIAESRHTQTMAFGDQLNAQKIGHFTDQVAAGMRRPVSGSGSPGKAPKSSQAPAAQPWNRPAGASPSAVRSAASGNPAPAPSPAPQRQRPNVPVPPGAAPDEGLNKKQAGNFGRVSDDLGDIARRMNSRQVNSPDPATSSPDSATPKKQARRTPPPDRLVHSAKPNADPEPQATPAPQQKDNSAGGHVTPSVRQLAEEHGVNPHGLTGTGANGRVRKRDVRDAAVSSAESRMESFSSGVNHTPASRPRATGHITIQGNYARNPAQYPASAPGDSSVKRPAGPGPQAAPARGDSIVKRATEPSAVAPAPARGDSITKRPLGPAATPAPAPARGDSVAKRTKAPTDRPRSSGHVMIPGNHASSPAFSGIAAPGDAVTKRGRSKVRAEPVTKRNSGKTETVSRPNTSRPRAMGRVNIPVTEEHVHNNSLVPGVKAGDTKRPGFQRLSEAAVNEIKNYYRK
ncbi:E3 binding domain-containing protein [Streptosporangium sp. NPDC023825]|uniref:E3 binding domain-containing protein n=1 Tax=Streptosporangium sp. NPDC023825 TaxID=3154909 RepID=UPI0034205F4E